MRSHTVLGLPLVAVLALGMSQSGCVVRAGVGAYAEPVEPQMVMLDGGVYVVEDYDRPVFYDANYYWWYDGGVWYRSTYHNGGWVRVHTSYVPARIRRIDRPHRYRRYRAARASQRRAIRRHNRQDRRDYRRERRQDRRDVRHDRRDARKERRVNRRDARKERREDRRDERKDRRDERRERRRDYRGR